MAKKRDASKGPPEPADHHDRKLLTDVQRHGWHVIGVTEDEEGPAFAYSIGLYHTFGHPEVLVLGLAVEVMHRIINGIGELVRSGQRFEHLHESGDVLDNYNVAFRALERRHYPDYLGYAHWFYRGDNFLALQCVWPDSQHRYPWHAELRGALAARQPVLSDDKSWPFHEGPNRAVFATRPVLRDGHPILLVTHDQDGDWQFLCGTTNRPRDGQIVSLGCIFERDRALTKITDLPEGWKAFRRTKQAQWKREKLEAE